MNKKHLQIFFEQQNYKGSIEHYWHFLFGYYLPLINHLLDAQKFTSGDSKSLNITIQNCGPVINKILIDTLSAMHVKYDWSDDLKLDRHRPSDKKSKFNKILRALLNKDVEIIKNRNELIMPRWDQQIQNDLNPAFFQQTLCNIGSRFPGLFSDFSCCKNTIKDKYLLIKRSPEHQFYSKSQGKAENRTYGAGRRYLKGLEQCLEQLVLNGIDSMIYQPGIHNIFCQMHHFSQCSGLIGVRGSDFANMLWMSKESLAVLIHSESFKNKTKTPPQRKLASLLSIDYQELESNGEISPTIEAEIILPIIERHRKKANGS